MSEFVNRVEKINELVNFIKELVNKNSVVGEALDKISNECKELQIYAETDKKKLDKAVKDISYLINAIIKGEDITSLKLGEIAFRHDIKEKQIETFSIEELSGQFIESEGE